jgi:hypothetical protein
MIPRLGLENEFAFLEIHRHPAVVRHFAGNQLARQRRFHRALQKPLQWPRAMDRVVAFAGDVFLRRVAQHQLDVPVRQPRAQ